MSQLMAIQKCERALRKYLALLTVIYKHVQFLSWSGYSTLEKRTMLEELHRQPVHDDSHRQPVHDDSQNSGKLNNIREILLNIILLKT